MNGNKSCGGHALRIAVGMMVLGLLMVGGMGAVSVEGWNKTSVETNSDLLTISALESSITVTVPNGLLLRKLSPRAEFFDCWGPTSHLCLFPVLHESDHLSKS